MKKQLFKNYWEKFSEADPLALAVVNINVFEDIIALWEVYNVDKPQIQIILDDYELKKIGELSLLKFLSHSYIKERKSVFLLDFKKNLLTNG